MLNRSFDASGKTHREIMTGYIRKLQEIHNTQSSVQFPVSLELCYHPFYKSPVSTIVNKKYTLM